MGGSDHGAIAMSGAAGVKLAKLGTVLIGVTDLERSLAFYPDALGLTGQFASGGRQRHRGPLRHLRDQGVVEPGASVLHLTGAGGPVGTGHRRGMGARAHAARAVGPRGPAPARIARRLARVSRQRRSVPIRGPAHAAALHAGPGALVRRGARPRDRPPFPTHRSFAAGLLDRRALFLRGPLHPPPPPRPTPPLPAPPPGISPPRGPPPGP